MPICDKCKDVIPFKYAILEQGIGTIMCFKCHMNIPKFRSNSYKKKVKKMIRRMSSEN